MGGDGSVAGSNSGRRGRHPAVGRRWDRGPERAHRRLATTHGRRRFGQAWRQCHGLDDRRQRPGRRSDQRPRQQRSRHRPPLGPRAGSTSRGGSDAGAVRIWPVAISRSCWYQGRRHASLEERFHGRVEEREDGTASLAAGLDGRPEPLVSTPPALTPETLGGRAIEGHKPQGLFRRLWDGPLLGVSHRSRNCPCGERAGSAGHDEG